MLFVSSLVFYGWGEPVYVVYMLLSIVIHYGMGLLIERHRERKLAKVWLGLSVCFSLGLLGYFKYSDFFIANFNAATGLSVPLLNVALPIGISFYTFQIMSYTIDVYRQHTSSQKNIISLATYIALFPQLIAGPIVRYVDVAAALAKREHNLTRIRYGLRRFIYGLAKKVLLANSLGELCQVFVKTQNPSVLFNWMYAVAFSLQIYFDFSGYSDMAIGLGRLLGFDFLENFIYPYNAKSITEFWRCWHISLSTWFRDYLYIPLGGNRVSKGRWVFNILAVWMLTGFWHGAAWNYIFWGLLFAIILINEKLWLGRRLAKLPDIISHIYVLLIVVIGFVLFDAPSLTVAADRITAMFGAANIALTDKQTLYLLRNYSLIFILAALGSTPLFKLACEHWQKHERLKKIATILEPVVCIALLVITTAYLVDSSFDPFLYFRF